MWQVKVIFLLLIIGQAEMYNQSDYILIPERWGLVQNNEKYMVVTLHNFKFNRTHFALNGTYEFKRDYQNDLLMEVQAYKFQSNEYRLFPLIFTANICDTIAKNDFGIMNIYDCGYAARCPLKRGRYLFCNWAPDYTKFPPYMPTGRYRLDMKFVYFSNMLAHLQWYYEIKSAKWL